MGVMDFIRNMFSKGYKDGRNFTADEKREIIKLLKDYKRDVLVAQEWRDYCYGMCKYFARKEYYKKLCSTYYNREWFKERVETTRMHDVYWWPRRDYESRIKAADVLIQAIEED